MTAIDGADFELYPGEILAVIGDNGAGKSSLIKALSGAMIPDQGEIRLDGEPVHFKSPLEARRAGIETVYQDLAVAPALDIATNLFLGREKRRAGPAGSVLRMLDHKGMREEAVRQMENLQIGIRSMSQAVETLSGGQRQGVAVARAAAWARKLVIMDEPTAALGVKESGQVLELIKRVRDNGLPVILISHNMPHVFEIADRIHIHRLGRRVAVVTPQTPHHARRRGHHDRRGRARPRASRPGARGSGRAARRRRAARRHPGPLRDPGTRNAPPGGGAFRFGLGSVDLAGAGSGSRSRSTRPGRPPGPGGSGPARSAGPSRKASASALMMRRMDFLLMRIGER